MKNSPSKKPLQEAEKINNIPLTLIDKSRSEFDVLFKEKTVSILDQFDLCSEQYESDPSPDNLLKMAEIILPISKNTASMYCKMALYKNPFHEEIKELMKKIR